jgi:hypothetical protein
MRGSQVKTCYLRYFSSRTLSLGSGAGDRKASADHDASLPSSKPPHRGRARAGAHASDRANERDRREIHERDVRVDPARAARNGRRTRACGAPPCRGSVAPYAVSSVLRVMVIQSETGASPMTFFDGPSGALPTPSARTFMTDSNDSGSRTSVDTNIVVYAYDLDDRVLSAQVFNELCYAMMSTKRKTRLSPERLVVILSELATIGEVTVQEFSARPALRCLSVTSTAAAVYRRRARPPRFPEGQTTTARAPHLQQ